MPVYNLVDAKTAPLVPKLSKKQIEEIELLDSLDIEPGLVYTNNNGEQRRVVRVIRPAGAFSPGYSEVLQSGPQGQPLIWRTVDAAGDRCDINFYDTKKEEHGHCYPEDWQNWVGKNPPLVEKKVIEPTSASIRGEELIKKAQRKREEYDAVTKSKEVEKKEKK